MNTHHPQKNFLTNHRSLALPSFLAILFILLAGSQVAAMISTEYRYKTTDTSLVLGDSEEEEKEDEAEKKQEEAQKEEDKRNQERQKENEKNEASDSHVNNQQTETEIETKDGLKIKTKIEDNGQRKLEIEQKKFKLKVKTAEPKNQPSDDLVQDQETDLDFDDDLFEVATGSANPSVTRRNIKADSDFPLTIDPSTNTLSVTTPRGTQAVTILPDQAMDNLYRLGLISALPTNLSESTDITLTEKDGQAVYVVQTQKRFRLFGVIELDAPTTLTVSAEDGQVISQERSLLTDIVDALSP